MGRWVAAGDSYMEPGSRLVTAIEGALGVPVEAAGVRGSGMSYWLRNPAQIANVARATDVLLVHLGGNDPSHSAAQYRELDRRFRQAGARRVLWLPPPAFLPGSPLAGRDASIKRAMRAAGITIANPLLYPKLGTAHFARDLVHLTAAGSRTWGPALARGIRNTLAERGLRRRYLTPVVVSVALLAAALGVGVWAWSRRKRRGR